MRISGTSTRAATRLISSSKAQSPEARSSTSSGSLSPSSSESVREQVGRPPAHGHDAGVALVEPGLLDRPHHPLAVGAGDLALQLEAELAVEQQVGVAVGLRLEVHHPARRCRRGRSRGAPRRRAAGRASSAPPRASASPRRAPRGRGRAGHRSGSRTWSFSSVRGKCTRSGRGTSGRRVASPAMGK